MDAASTSTSFKVGCDTTQNIFLEEIDSVRPVKHFLITWTVEDFLKLSSFREKPLYSPTIQIDSSDSLSLIVFPYFLFTSEKKIQFCLRRNATNDKSVYEISYRFGIKKSTETWFQEKIKLAFPFDGRDQALYDIFEYFGNPFALFEQALTIICEIYITFNQDIDKYTLKKYNESTADLMDLSIDLYKLLQRVETTDAKVKAKNQEIPVHKAILSARSPVFAQMFMDGKSCIIVEDDDYYHIQNILLYIYTGNFYWIGLNGIWIGLYESAKRYKIRGLIKLLTPTEITVSTLMKEDSINFTWKINRFSSRKVNFDECITSPPFHVGSKTAPVWYLDIYPEGYQRSVTDVGIFLRTNDSSKFLGIKFEISILDNLNQVRYTKYTDQPILPNFVFGFPEYLNREKLHKEDLIQGESLILNCKIVSLSTVESYDKISSVSQSALEEFECLENLSADMENLALDGGFTDCILKISDSLMFPVHRVIITARCDGLNRIIETSKSKVVPLEDISPEALEEIIFYIYSGKMKNYTCHVSMKLYEGAKIFKMATLGTKCIGILILKVDEKSVCDVISFAFKHEETMLFSRCLLFFKMFRNEIMSSMEWQNFEKREQLVAYMICRWLETPSDEIFTFKNEQNVLSV